MVSGVVWGKPQICDFETFETFSHTTPTPSPPSVVDIYIVGVRLQIWSPALATVFKENLIFIESDLL